MSDSQLQHYGVKGMRWGVRKASYQSKATLRTKMVGPFYERPAEISTKIRALQGSRMANTWKRIDNDNQRVAKAQKKAYDRIDKMKNKTLADIDKNAKGKVDRAVGHLAVKSLAGLANARDQHRVAKTYIKKFKEEQKERKSDLKAKKLAALDKINSKYADQRKNAFKGKGLIGGLKETLRVHNAEHDEAIVTLLELEAKSGM